MTPRPSPLTIIGRAELIQFLDASQQLIPAKVDTGADVSSVWASGISEDQHGLHFRLFGPGSKYHTGESIHIPKGEYRQTYIANSFGHRQTRYVVKMRVKIGERIIWASFTLADRSVKTYPVLLGRRFLKGKFLVDVAQDTLLARAKKSDNANVRANITDK